MFLDLFGDRSARWPQTMHTGIMFADLSGIHSKSLVESCQPEKCPWTYRGVHLSPRRVESTEKVFMDLSRRCPPPDQTVPNLKNVPGPIRASLRSLATDDAYRKNVRRPIGNSLQVPGRSEEHTS